MGNKSKCGYCLGGYCLSIDCRFVELRTSVAEGWNGGKTWAGTKCREYLRGHFRYAKERAAQRKP